MTTPDFNKAEKLSTPAQAEALNDAIKNLTADKELRPFSDRTWVTVSDIEIPASVDAHLPVVGDDSYSVDDSAFITFILDTETNTQKTSGVVGMVSFTRRNEVKPGLIYAAHANYHVTQKDGIFGVERHDTNTEHGMHMVRRMVGEIAMSDYRPLDRATMRAMMYAHDVSGPELDDIILFLQNAQ